MYWFVGRTGPVRTMDFYRLMAPFIAASVVGILACMGFRHFFKVGNPVLGVAACFSLIAAANLVVLSLTTSGRATLRDIRDSLLLLRPVRAKAALEAQ
jgi:hypothetical protein